MTTVFRGRGGRAERPPCSRSEARQRSHVSAQALTAALSAGETSLSIEDSPRELRERSVRDARVGEGLDVLLELKALQERRDSTTNAPRSAAVRLARVDRCREARTSRKAPADPTERTGRALPRARPAPSWWHRR